MNLWVHGSKGAKVRVDSGNRSPEDTIFPFNTALTQPISVSVDGTKIAEKNYAVSEDGTTVTLSSDYLTTLSVGNHSIVPFR